MNSPTHLTDDYPPDMKVPNYDVIIKECKKKMAKVYEKKKNGWVDEHRGWYIDQRLRREYKEYIDATSPDSKREELVDIINTACMMIEHLDKLMKARRN